MRQTLARATVVGLVAAAAFVGWASSAYAIDDQNCSDFPSQQAAQIHLREDPTDPDRLDAEKDGIACEGNAAPKDLVAVDRSGVVTPVTAAPTPVVAAATTPASGLASTGMRHTPQAIELAVMLVGLGTALVLLRRPGVIR